MYGLLLAPSKTDFAFTHPQKEADMHGRDPSRADMICAFCAKNPGWDWNLGQMEF
jgi:hypothetical protein